MVSLFTSGQLANLFSKESTSGATYQTPTTTRCRPLQPPPASITGTTPIRPPPRRHREMRAFLMNNPNTTVMKGMHPSYSFFPHLLPRQEYTAACASGSVFSGCSPACQPRRNVAPAAIMAGFVDRKEPRFLLI
ncbi:hypothetical protein E2C01_038688 [Portunus trituberculatus]|uniref:Uncharacterized protein n=1 Tax=Portunus trituberculatus TaxID=210409 RepID=A0A5B7FHG1_PORTR|nr:hypothetical protein [Portunus trituberculatus]